MTPRQTWIIVAAAVITIVTGSIFLVQFLTGRNTLAAFLSKQNEYESITSSEKKVEGGRDSRTAKKSTAIKTATAETTLVQLLDLGTPNKMAGLQADQLTKALDGKTVILCGYLIDSWRSFLGSSAEISSSKTGERTFYLNIDRSEKDNWAIPKGSYIGVQTTLKQPMVGTMVGNNAKLLQIGKDCDQTR